MMSLLYIKSCRVVSQRYEEMSMGKWMDGKAGERVNECG